MLLFILFISIISFLLIYFNYRIISLKSKVFEKIEESELIRKQKIHYLYICQQKYKDDSFIQENIENFIKQSFSPLNYSIQGFNFEESRFHSIIQKLEIIKQDYNDIDSFDNIKNIIDKHISCLNELKKLFIKKETYFISFPINLLKFLH